MTTKNKIVTLNPIAQRAERLLDRWGPCPFLPDGEDSTGKQKFRVMTPSEVVSRAIELSDALDRELYALGHQWDE